MPSGTTMNRLPVDVSGIGCTRNACSCFASSAPAFFARISSTYRWTSFSICLRPAGSTRRFAVVRVMEMQKEFGSSSTYSSSTSSDFRLS